MERSFAKEIELLKLGEGEVFRGEGILAVTKALLQSGVAYVGGYQGAPVSHLLDVMVQAGDFMKSLGVHVEACANEASAAAMLAASITYKVRGAVTWKSVVGTNVASDALSNLASPGVLGGAMVVVGEDYGEGASIIQERTYAFAMKSTMWLLDPRPDLPSMTRMVEKGFELSEASNSPVFLQLRIRACHVQGEFVAKDNVAPAISENHRVSGPPRFDYGRLAHPPATFVQEKLKVEQRRPAAQRFIRDHNLNEFFDGDLPRVGIILQGGLYNVLMRSLARLGLADLFGKTRVPLLVLNVTYPLVPDQITEFCAGKDAVLVVEEGNPAFIEDAINVALRKADIQTRIHGKDVLPEAGDYTAAVLAAGLAGFLQAARPAGVDLDDVARRAGVPAEIKRRAEALVGHLPPRPPGFCVGCPERPVFSALKLVQRELGAVHVNADIGCHAFGTFKPFNMGNNILGYGMSLASAAATSAIQDRRTISIMGDGGFWHNGLQSGVTSALFNKGDSILVIMQNGYASATGQQYLPSSATSRFGEAPGMSIERTLKSIGVPWLRTVRTYSVGKMITALREALTTTQKGLKIIIADGECQLARQRRLRSENAKKLAAGERVVKPRFGVDDEVCTGDHSCIRLSACPSLTIKPNPDPLRTDPVASVNNGCVGCGLCGEVAHAAVLCPSFYRAELIQNASWLDRTLHGLRRRVIRALTGPAPARAADDGVTDVKVAA